MKKEKRKAKKDRINAKRRGLFNSINSVDELSHGDLVAGNYLSWVGQNGASFSIDSAPPIYRHRCGPVPQIRKSGKYGRWFRHPKTKKVLTFGARCMFHEKDETFDEPKIRSKARNLPSYYDDIYRGRQRSWKCHRKNQWKNN